MIRRNLALAAAVVAGLAAVSACSTVDKPAASVNGVEISADELSSDIDAVATLQSADAPLPIEVGAATIDGDVARGWLATRVRWQIALDKLKADGVALDEALVGQVEQQLVSSTPTWADLTEAFQTRAIEGIAAEEQLGEQGMVEAFVTADVDVASTIGNWDPVTGQIVPAGL